MNERRKPSTEFDVQVTKEYLSSQKYKDFCDAAYEAYEKNNPKFFSRLSDDELIILHVSCYLHDNYPLTRAYDDEVMEEAFQRKNWKQLLLTGDIMIFENLPDSVIDESYEKHFRDSGEGLTTEERRQRIIEKVKNRF